MIFLERQDRATRGGTAGAVRLARVIAKLAERPLRRRDGASRRSPARGPIFGAAAGGGGGAGCGAAATGGGGAGAGLGMCVQETMISANAIMPAD